MVHNSRNFNCFNCFWDYIFILNKMNKKIILNSLIILSFIALSFAYFVEFILRS